MTMKTYTSVHPTTVEHVRDESGWKDGPDPDSLVDGHGNQVFIVEEKDGHVTIEFDDEETDADELLAKVPFEQNVGLV